MTLGELTEMGPVRAANEVAGLARKTWGSDNCLLEAALEGSVIAVELCVLGLAMAHQCLSEDRDYQRRMLALSAEAGQQG